MYVAPLGTGVAKPNCPSAITRTVSTRGVAPATSTSSRSASPVPARPLTVPLTRNVLVAHVTATFATLAPITVPAPWLTLHTWMGEGVGWLRTWTEYVVPSRWALEKVNAPFAVTSMFSVPLF